MAEGAREVNGLSSRQWATSRLLAIPRRLHRLGMVCGPLSISRESEAPRGRHAPTGQQLLQFRLAPHARDLVGNLPPLKQEQGWNRLNPVSPGQLRTVVDVHLDHFGLRRLRGDLFQNGSQGLARAAPVGIEIDQNPSVGSKDFLVEVRRVGVNDSTVAFWVVSRIPKSKPGHDCRPWGRWGDGTGPTAALVFGGTPGSAHADKSRQPQHHHSHPGGNRHVQLPLMSWGRRRFLMPPESHLPQLMRSRAARLHTPFPFPAAALFGNTNGLFTMRLWNLAPLKAAGSRESSPIPQSMLPGRP